MRSKASFQCAGTFKAAVYLNKRICSNYVGTTDRGQPSPSEIERLWFLPQLKSIFLDVTISRTHTPTQADTQEPKDRQWNHRKLRCLTGNMAGTHAGNRVCHYTFLDSCCGVITHRGHMEYLVENGLSCLFRGSKFWNLCPKGSLAIAWKNVCCEWMMHGFQKLEHQGKFICNHIVHKLFWSTHLFQIIHWKLKIQKEQNWQAFFLLSLFCKSSPG